MSRAACSLRAAGIGQGCQQHIIGQGIAGVRRTHQVVSFDKGDIELAGPGEEIHLISGPAGPEEIAVLLARRTG